MNPSSSNYINKNGRGSSGGVDGTQPPEQSISAASALTHASAASARNEPFEGWTCSMCSFLNEDPLHLACAICGTTKMEQQDIVRPPSSSIGSNLILPGKGHKKKSHKKKSHKGKKDKKKSRKKKVELDEDIGAAYDGAENSPTATGRERMKLEEADDADGLPMHDYAAMLHEADIAGKKKSGTDANEERKLELDEEINEAPTTDAQITSRFEAGKKPGPKKKVELDEEVGAPMTDAQVASQFEAGKKPAAAAAPTSGGRGGATAMSANHRTSNQRPSASHRSSSPRPINSPKFQNSRRRRSQRQRQTDRIPSQRQQSAPSEVTTPPPHSTPPSISDEENTLPPPTLDAASPTNNNEENSPPNDEENPPLPVLEATLVVDSPPVPNVEATLILPNQNTNDEPRVVYMATQLNSNYKKYSLAVLVSLLIGGLTTAIAMLVVVNSSNNGNEVDVQPVEQTPVTTNPPSAMLNSTTQSPVPPPSNPPLNEMTVAPTTAITLAPVTRPTSMPVPATWAPTLRADLITPPPTLPPTNRPTTDQPSRKPTLEPTTEAPTPEPSLEPTPRPVLSPMDQLQSSALELIPNEVIYSHTARENVAMHGDTVIVGAPSNNNERGFATVYIRDDKGGWSEQVKLEAPDGADNDRFGWSVAIHGNTIIVGANRDNDNGTWSGSVYVFVQNGGTWIYQAKLLALDGAANDRFGRSVGIVDDTVIIGADGDDNIRGSVHVFVRKNGIWTQQAKLTAPDGNVGDYFGYSVGIFRDTVIVGAPRDDDNGLNSGSAHLFALKKDIWIHQAELTAPDGNASEDFGSSVSIFGDTVIVGAPSPHRLSSGSAQVFTLDNTIWTHQAKLLAPDGFVGDRFGWSVGIFGDTVVVGSLKDDDNRFGRSLGIFGGIIDTLDEKLTGAVDLDNVVLDNVVDSGSLHLFTHNEDAWDYHAKLLAPKLGTKFGQSVVTYNGTVVASSGSGEVYVFSSDSD